MVPNRGFAGFTLFELLVALALVVLLLGAIVFNFRSVVEGAELNEGTERMKRALVLARAHAAHTQRPVRMVFEADDDRTFTDPVYRLRFYERPLNNAGNGSDGVFGGGSGGEGDVAPPGYSRVESLRGPAAQVNDLVVVRQVRPLDRSGRAIDAEDDDRDFDLPATPPAILFHPDGSSESAEIVLGSRDILDERRMLVRIVGVTGRITSSLQRDEDDGDEPERREDDYGGDALDPGYRIER